MEVPGRDGYAGPVEAIAVAEKLELWPELARLTELCFRPEFKDREYVTRFQSMAKEAMAGIYSRGHVPIVTGGTGFYIQALAYDIDFTENEDHSGIREKLEQLSAEKGEEHLHQMLAEIDPESAEAIHANNVKRVIRAIEYYRLTGEKISEHNKREREKQSPYDLYYYVLTRDRAALYERIVRRVEPLMEPCPGDEGER